MPRAERMADRDVGFLDPECLAETASVFLLRAYERLGKRGGL